MSSDTKISALTDGVTANATDRIPVARAGANNYVTPTYLATLMGFPTVTPYVTGTFTITITGMTAGLTGTAAYTVIGNLAVLYIPPLTGTSNATTMTATGLPAAITPATFHSGLCVAVEDNTANIATPGMARVETTNSITFFKDLNATAFTASGTKGLSNGATLVYNLN